MNCFDLKRLKWEKPDGHWNLMRLTPAFPISFRFSAQRLMDSLLPQAKDRVLFVPPQQPRRKRGERGGSRGQTVSRVCRYRWCEWERKGRAERAIGWWGLGSRRRSGGEGLAGSGPWQQAAEKACLSPAASSRQRLVCACKRQLRHTI